MTPPRLAAAARATPGIVLAVFALVCMVALWRVLAVTGLRVPLDPNEGWNAYHAAAAVAGSGCTIHSTRSNFATLPPE